MRIGVSLMGARDQLSAGKISICKESRRGPGNPRRVGGVAIKVVWHVVFLVINCYTYSAMKYKTGIEMGIVQLLT